MLLDGLLNDILGESTGQGAKFAPFSPPFAHAQSRENQGFSPNSPVSPQSTSPGEFAPVRLWMELMGESPEVIAEYQAKCEVDPAVMEFFLRYAKTTQGYQPLSRHQLDQDQVAIGAYTSESQQ